MPHDDRDVDSLSVRLTYLLIGGGLGAILALLLAPKAGSELRSDIADATRRRIDRSREATERLMNTSYEKGRAAALAGDDDFPEPFDLG